MTTFPLTGLLRLRRLEQDQRAADLARANGRRRDAADRTGGVRGRLGSSPAEVRDRQALLAMAVARSSTRAMLDELAAAEAEAEAHAAEAQEAHREARARTTSLEKLEERHDAAVAAEELRAEQLALDEAAGRSWAAAHPEDPR